MLAASRYIDRLGMRKSQEGLGIVRAITTGGTTLIYCACATPPPDWFLTKYGIDLHEETAETMEELNIRPLPDHLVGAGARRIMEAANGLGYEWKVFPRFINPERCIPGCSNCILGCTHGAKWTARNFIGEAKANDCVIYTKFNVHNVIGENGKAAGVFGFWRNRRVEVFGNIVVVAAGGLETPMILQKSGLSEAGRNFFCDPMSVVYGTIEDRGIAYDVPNTGGSMKFHRTDGIFLSDFIDPRLSFPVQMLMKGIKHLPVWFKYNRTLGILVKIKDTPGGRINANGTFSKSLTGEDQRKMKRGISLAEQILVKAGASPSSLVSTRARGAHPGGTAAINRVVDKNLETKIENLYVADASVFPEPMASPQVLTIISLAKRLARQLEAIL